jgi:hypothetical protein
VRPHALTIALLVVASTLTIVQPAAADERACRACIGSETVDDLRVPAGASCQLTGTRVSGNVLVEGGATLVARQVRVDGNVQAEV